MVNSNMVKRLFLAFSILGVFLGAGCSGGGGGDDFFGPAIVSLDANPRTIFVGDRALISVDLEEVNEDGVVLVFRYPTALSYVDKTALLEVEDSEVKVTPLVNAGRKGSIYLAFVFSGETFGEDLRGKLTLQLTGLKPDDNAILELDPSIRDTDLPDDEQFNINNPVFGTDTEVTLRVKK